MRDKSLGTAVNSGETYTLGGRGLGGLSGFKFPSARSTVAPVLSPVADLEPGPAPSARYRTRSRSAVGVSGRVVVGDGLCATLPATVVGVLIANGVGPDLKVLAYAVVLVGAVVVVGMWLLLLTLARAYEPRFLFSGSAEVHRVVAAGAGLTTLVTVAGWLFVPARLAPGVLIAALSVLGTTVASRWALRLLSQHENRTGRARSRVLAVGSTAEVRAVTERLEQNHYHGWRVVASCTPELNLGRSTHSDPVRIGVSGDVRSIAESARRVDADVVLLCPSGATDLDSVAQLQRSVESEGRDIALAPPMMEAIGPRVSVESICGLPMVRVQRPELSGPRRVIKSLADRTVASVALLLLSPMLLLTALAVRLDSRGPAFFRQERVGRDGRTFTMWKLRTMLVDAEAVKAALAAKDDGAGPLFKIKRDPRITRLGRLLRKTSLDELPQLINIVRGEMSLVGPRPALPDEVAKYDEVTRRRLLVPPGLTGLWQVHGRSDLSWEESKRLDVRYVENWSLGFDLSIVMRTIAVVLVGRGAY